MSSSVEEAFRNTSIIDWSKQYEFMALDQTVSSMIMRISLYDKENPIEVYPCNYYYLPPNEAKDLKLRLAESKNPTLLVKQFKYCNSDCQKLQIMILQENSKRGGTQIFKFRYWDRVYFPTRH